MFGEVPLDERLDKFDQLLNGIAPNDLREESKTRLILTSQKISKLVGHEGKYEIPSSS